MKLLDNITLFAKYVGLKKAFDTYDTNTTVFQKFFPEGDLQDRVIALDEKILPLGLTLVDSIEEHRKLFLEYAGDLVLEGTLTDTFLRLYLIIVYINRGGITDSLNTAVEMLKAVLPDKDEREVVTMVTEFAKDALLEGFVSPMVEVIDDNGDTELVDGSDNGTVIDGESVVGVRMSLSSKGRALVEKEIETIEAKKRQKVYKPDNSEFETLMAMDSPSKMLN